MAERHVPAPLREGHLCKECSGTGADIQKTLAIPEWDSGHIRCRACNGNGIDPAEYFRWSNEEKEEGKQ